MKKLDYTLRRAWRAISVSAFIVLVGFWCIKIGYCAYAFVTSGTPGIEHVLTRGMLTTSPDPKDWGQMQWGQIAALYALIALVTILLWLDNKRFLHRPRNNLT